MRTHPFRRTATAALLILAAVASAQTVDGKPAVKQEILDRVTTMLATRAYVPGLDFAKWTEYIKVEKDKLDAAPDDEAFTREVNRALSQFKASHIVLMTPKSTTARRTGSTVGIGISGAPAPDGLLIIRTVPNAPAAKGGLVPGDTILKVDGKAVEGTRGIAGPAGSTVRLTVRKGEDKKEKDVVLIRQPFSTQRPEELAWIDRDTAKLTIYTFDMGYDGDRVESHLRKAKGAKTLVLDLRDNGGGAVFNLQHLMGLLMPRDASLGTFVSRSLVEAYVKETKDQTPEAAEAAAWTTGEGRIYPFRNRALEPYTGKLVVLQNGGSGSASEIAAAALRENRGATVIGTKSAGAVLVSVMGSATNGFTIQYPLSDYITPKGLRLEGNGVTPDIVVEEPRFRLPKDPDPVVEKVREVVSVPPRRKSG